MAEITVPSLDFSSLGNLGNVYKQAQNDAIRQQTLASLGSGTGQIDPRQLYASGDLSLAQLGQQIQNHNDQLAQQQWQQQHTAQRDTVEDKFRQAQLAISQRAADRADAAGPEQSATQRAAVASKYGLNPGTPEFKSFVLTGSLPPTVDPNKVNVLGKGGELYKTGPDGQPIILHKNADEEGPDLSDESVDLLARRAASGDTRALVGLGRGAQGRASLVKINNRVSEIMKDDPNGAQTILNNIAVQAGNVSGARTLGTKATNFGVAEKSMEESLPIALEASQKVPRTAYPMLNRLIQTGETNVGDPNLKQFLIATDTAAKDYARTINPGGQTRESDIAYARHLISTADGPETYAAALKQLKIEAGVTRRALERQKAELGGKPINPKNAIVAPKVGEIRDGYRYKGDDPGSPDNWEPAQ